MSRDICVRMHDAIVALRPEWHHPDDDQGALKVVMTGSAADGPDWQEHIRTKPRRKALADRFRDPDTDFKLVIVRDMWLTGFDAPSLHTMYVDKPMRGHNLMQAIARVNRVYPGKDGGLVVAYLPIQTQLQEALQDYTEADQELTGRAAGRRRRRHDGEVRGRQGHVPRLRLRRLLHRQPGRPAHHPLQRRRLHPRRAARRSATATSTPSPRWAGPMPWPIPTKRPWPSATRSASSRPSRRPLVKSRDHRRHPHRPHHAGRRLGRAADRGPGRCARRHRRPLRRGRPGASQHLAALRRVPASKCRPCRRRTWPSSCCAVSSRTKSRRAAAPTWCRPRSFADMLKRRRRPLQRTGHRRRRTSSTELIELAKEMQRRRPRGEDLGLERAPSSPSTTPWPPTRAPSRSWATSSWPSSPANCSQTVRRNATIDWSVQESARAKMRVAVKRILRQYGYPPDLQAAATRTVVQQAELFAGGGGVGHRRRPTSRMSTVGPVASSRMIAGPAAGCPPTPGEHDKHACGSESTKLVAIALSGGKPKLDTQLTIAVIGAGAALLVAVTSLVATLVSVTRANGAAQAIESLRDDLEQRRTRQSLADDYLASSIAALDKLVSAIQEVKDVLQLICSAGEGTMHEDSPLELIRLARRTTSTSMRNSYLNSTT